MTRREIPVVVGQVRADVERLAERLSEAWAAARIRIREFAEELEDEIGAAFPPARDGRHAVFGSRPMRRA